MQVKGLNAEALMYWQTMQKIKSDQVFSTVDGDDIDELDVLATYTSLPVLKALAIKTVAQHTPTDKASGDNCQ